MHQYKDRYTRLAGEDDIGLRFQLSEAPWTILSVLVFSIYFSNSLIIHEEKTKEITTVKEVWICDPNYHKIREVLL